MSDFNKHKERVLREHLLQGCPITQMEASVLFGLCDLIRAVSRLRKMGFRFEKRRVPYALALRRINKVVTLEAPAELPIREVLLTEYRVQS
jgi:hypothetical protein